MVRATAGAFPARVALRASARYCWSALGRRRPTDSQVLSMAPYGPLHKGKVKATVKVNLTKTQTRTKGPKTANVFGPLTDSEMTAFYYHKRNL